MGAIRERVEKLTELSWQDAEEMGEMQAAQGGGYLSRADVLALADELDAKIHELQRAYLSTRGTGTTAAEWARLYDAIHALIDNQQRKEPTE